MNIRLAEVKDIKQLIQMRWDFTVEFDEEKGKASFDEFENECQTFLENALTGD